MHPTKNTTPAAKLSAAALICALACSGTTFAQDDPAAAHSRNATTSSTLLSIRFNGGSVQGFVKQLEKAYEKRTRGAKFNLILTGNPAAVRLPAFELFDTTVADALEALEGVAHEKNNRVRLIKKSARAGRGKAIYILESTGAKVSKPRRVSRPYSEAVVFSIRELTARQNGTKGPYELEAVLGAIEAGLDIARDPDEDPDSGYRPVIRHHAASMLLFVRAKHDEIMMIRSVLEQLKQDVLRHKMEMQRQRRSAGVPAVEMPAESKGQPKKRKGTR